IGYYSQGGSAAAVAGVLVILLLFACVVLHEFGHAFAAKAFGINTPDITLLPIGEVARLERMPEEPIQELIIAAAGPAVNLIIALCLLLTGGSFVYPPTAESSLNDVLLTINVVLLLFNLLPAFPMDGGRVLRALLATRLSYARATQIAASIGQGCAFVFGFIGLFSNPFLLFIALFVYIGASQEAALAQMRDVSRRFPVSSAMVREFRSLPETATLEEAVDALLATSQHDFPVIDAAGNVAGILTRHDLIGALRKNKPDLQKKVHEVPHKPGVYLMRDRFNRVIYVGKARDLRKRVSSYFLPSKLAQADLKTRALLEATWDFETHVVRSEAESVLLEGKLIKEYRPRYNISFRD